MKIALFILIGIILGYVGKDLLTTESQIVYHIKRLRAKDSGVVSVTADATAVKRKDKLNFKDKRNQRKEARKNRK